MISCYRCPPTGIIALKISQPFINFPAPSPDRNAAQGGQGGGGQNGKKDGGGGGARGDSQKGGKGGRGGDREGGSGGKDGGKGGENDDEGWSRGDSSVSPLIPPFMRKLFMALPRHIGPQPDAEGLLKALRERALPDKPRFVVVVVFLDGSPVAAVSGILVAAASCPTICDAVVYVACTVVVAGSTLSSVQFIESFLGQSCWMS